MVNTPHTSYHISAGEESCCSWDDIAEGFNGAEPANRQFARALTSYRTATLEEIETRKPEFDSLFGRCNKLFMMKAIKLYGAFAGLNTAFDNSRLRAEGFPASPRFCDYIAACQQSCAGSSIADQMLIDFAA